MKKEKNSIWVFFASVRLALFTLIVLAMASIVGTIIQQGQPAEYYVQKFGPGTAKLFHALDISNMYNSWWFIALLVTLSLNLIICTLDRLPAIWSMVTRDNLSTSVDKLEQTGQNKTFYLTRSVDEIENTVCSVLEDAGWNPKRVSKPEDVILFFAHKGAWTRLGLIAVHSSILIIFIGAIIGKTMGYKGGLLLPETNTSDHIYEHGTNKEIPLGFKIRCDRFQISYYDNGAPKEFRSDITIIENDSEVLKSPIMVNNPLDYGGLTFYQANYEPVSGQYIAHLLNERTNSEKDFLMQAGKETAWNEEGVMFGIINIMGPVQGGKYRYKVWFSDNKAKPVSFWLDEGGAVRIERPETFYSLTMRQRYATGLQIARDPGVWYVYTGCMMLLAGLYIVFFLSHRRIWIYIARENSRTRMLVSGSANKNRAGFEKNFSFLIKQLEQNENLDPSKEAS